MSVASDSPQNVQRVDPVSFALEPDFAPTEFIDVLRRSGLAERRPVDQADRILGMLDHASILAVARESSGRAVGVARAISDFTYCTYLSDLAVDRDFQRQSIGRALIQRVRDAGGGNATLVLLAAPAAVGYYPRLGLERHGSCWTMPGSNPSIAPTA